MQPGAILKILILIATRVGESITAERLIAIREDWKDLPFEPLFEVLWNWTKRHRGFPTPYEVRVEVNGDTGKLEDAEAEAAFFRAHDWVLENVDLDNGVMQWISSGGVRCPVKPSWGHWELIPGLPPRIDHAIRMMGGYQRFRHAIQGELTWVKRDFVKAWKDAEKVQQFLNGDAASKQLPDLGKAIKSFP